MRSNPTHVEPGNIRVTHRIEKIVIRQRSKVNQFKIDAMKELLDVVGEEDVDSLFLVMLDTAQMLGYNLQREPRAILSLIEQRFDRDETQALHPGR